MNKKHYIIALIALFVVMAIGFSSCEDEDNYATDYNTGTPPTATVTLLAGSITDNGGTIVVSSNQDGKVWYAAVPSAIDTITFEGYQFVLDEIDYYDAGNIDVESGVNDTVNLSLFEGNGYSVYVVATNEAGQSGTVSSALSITVTDESVPYISSFTPAKGVLVPIDKEIVLTFNEPVTYDPTKTIELFSDGGTYNEVINEANITVNGNVVTITHEDWPREDYINLVMGKGAFTDASGNLSDEIVAYPGTPNYWIETESLIDWANLEGTFRVTSENEIGFEDGESGGYLVTAEHTGDTEFTIYDLWGAGSTIVLEFDPSDNSITIPLQEIGLTHTSSGQAIRAYDTDPFGVAGDSGYVPGTYDPKTGTLKFFAWIHVDLGSFGFYTYDLQLIPIPAKGEVNGASNKRVEMNVKQL